jgi:hypothetical protein
VSLVWTGATIKAAPEPSLVKPEKFRPDDPFISSNLGGNFRISDGGLVKNHGRLCEVASSEPLIKKKWISGLGQ